MDAASARRPAIFARWHNSSIRFTAKPKTDGIPISKSVASFPAMLGQFRLFVSTGRRFTFNGRHDGFFVKVIAGVIHGYHSPHEKSVSLNYRATCPAIVPSIGYKF